MTQENFKLEFITVEPKNNILEDKDIIHYTNSRRNKTKIILSGEEYEEVKIIWQLRKYIGNEIQEWGYPRSSSQKLTNGITTEEIVKSLNHKNVFDFEYEPSQNDQLTIELVYVVGNIKGKYSRPYIGDYLSFLFDGEMWKINEGYDHLNNKYQEYKEGIIKYVV